MNNPASTPITGGHYSLLRFFLGLYLAVHFAQLIPFATELFSADGLLPATLSPLIGILPNPMAYYDSPGLVATLLSLGTVAGVLVAIGWHDRVASIFAILLLGWLFARNPLIANPSLPVVGWMLLAHVFTPTGAYGSWSARGMPEAWSRWFYPREIWLAAWIMLAVAYSYSGYTKMLSPSWVDGSAIGLVLDNPLARDHFGREFLLALPPVCLELLTWSVLWIELLFVPLCLNARTRKWAWLAMLSIQFGFLVFLDFADLTFPMLLIHLLTFDRNWVDSLRPCRGSVLFFDGGCAFCNGLVRFALAEDGERRLGFSPLQGKTFVEKDLQTGVDDSIVLLSADGEILYKSAAAIHCLEQLGGLWLLAGKLLAVFPLGLRDRCYDAIGRLRYRIAGRVPVESCRLLPPAYRASLLP